MIASELQSLYEFFHQHGEAAAAAMYMFSVLVQAIPTPSETSSMWHIYLYNLGHAAAGNWRVVGKKKE